MTVIDPNFTTVSRPRTHSPRKTVKQSFRGVVATWVGVLSLTEQEDSHSFNPVDKEFYKPVDRFELSNLSQAHQEFNNSVTFAPTIELSCFLQPFLQKIFSNYDSQNFQTLTRYSTGASPQAKSAVVAPGERITRELRRETTLERGANALLRVIKQAASINQRNSSSTTTINEQHVHVQFVGNRNVVAPTPAHLTTTHPNFAFHRNRTSPLTNRFWSTAIANVNKELTNFYRSSDNSFLIQRKLSTSRLANTSAFFTTVSLNFAVPKLTDVEKINQRIAHFVSSPALTYVKTQPTPNETLIQTLRELRTQAPQQKPQAVMQMPTIEQLTNQVKTQIERDIRIERERRGL